MSTAKFTNKLIRVGVDLDGTLARKLWTPEDPTDEIGPPIQANIEKLHELAAAGYKPYIHTSRPDYHVELIERWLLEHGLPFRDIRAGKPLFAAYVDDRAIHADAPSWLPETLRRDVQ